MGTLVGGHKRYLAHYRDNPEAAAALVKVGAKPGANIDPVEHAAFTAVANIILNLDEVITRE